MSQTKINIKTPDGVADCYLFHPSGKGPWPAVIFFMDGIAIRPALLAMAERLSSNGYYVLLPDMFYRAGPYEPFDGATVFNGGPERDRLMKLMQTVNNGSAMRDTGAFLDYLAQQSMVTRSKVGCTGYCMGGRFSLLAAGTYPDRVAAAASFHGGQLATDAPDSPHLVAPKIRGSVYVGVAGIDPHFPDAEKDRLKNALSTAGVHYQLETYPNVRHGFTMTDLPVYDREAAETHWERLLHLLGETLPHD
jgi:carboxymethylenebutenolidase